MSNQSLTKEQVPHIVDWQIAYAARELRQKKIITLTCLKSETNQVLEQLSSFSNSHPLMTKATTKPYSSKEVYLEIVDLV